jgi:hypothetical protein
MKGLNYRMEEELLRQEVEGLTELMRDDSDFAVAVTLSTAF